MCDCALRTASGPDRQALQLLLDATLTGDVIAIKPTQSASERIKRYVNQLQLELIYGQGISLEITRPNA
jgi:hypothetical protein